MTTTIGSEVFKVRGATSGGDPIVLGWQLPQTSTRYSGFMEASINYVAQGNRATAFSYPYSISVFGRREDSYTGSGSSAYSRVTVYGAPFWPDTWDGGTTANANNANIPLYGNTQWSDFQNADNRGQRHGSTSQRQTTGIIRRERSSPWRMAVRTSGNITGYNSGGQSIVDGSSFRNLITSKMWQDYNNTSDSRLRTAPVTDGGDARHYTTGPNDGMPYDGAVETKNHSRVMQVYYDSNSDIFRIMVAGNWNPNHRYTGGSRLQVAGLFLVEGFDYGENSHPYNGMITTKFYLEDASVTYSTSQYWYTKSTDQRTNPYPDDDVTIFTWSNITSNPFYDTVTDGGHTESNSTVQWNAIVYPIRF